jgi:hypothetical protein
MIQLTLLRKLNGPLSKQIRIDPDGKLASDSSACALCRGYAQRWRIDNIAEFAGGLAGFKSSDALALGAMVPELPDEVEITTVQRLNGAARPDLITRTLDYFGFRPGLPALALLDFDTKDMPAAIAVRLDHGFWPALCGVAPDLAPAARVERASTSAGLYRSDTGERLGGRAGCHVFVSVTDGADIGRFLDALHQRCWLAGLGWYALGAAGQLLDRSIVDRTVGSPERLVFEGPPRLVHPLAQDPRPPVAFDGNAIDTAKVCPSLSPVELARLQQLQARAALALRDQADRVRRDWIEKTAQRSSVAAAIVERRCAGVLRPECVLEFDDADLAGATVGDVLANPDKYIGETLADPLEGPTYGRGKAKLLRRGDGVAVHSLAHGLSMVFRLLYDAAAVDSAIRKAPKLEAVAALCRMIPVSDVNPVETERLIATAAKCSGAGKLAVKQALREALAAAKDKREQEQRKGRIAEVQDGRPQLPAPEPDDEWLPVVEEVTGILAASDKPEPPTRDPDGYMVSAWVRKVPRLHALTRANEQPLPPPDQVLIGRLSEPQLAELIERHVAFWTEDRWRGWRLVHLDGRFVRHMECRPGDPLPVLTAVATLPVVLDDGTVLTKNGLDRRFGAIFRIPDGVKMPKRFDNEAVGKALKFLIDEWMVDVTAKPIDKAVLVSLALSIIERVLLPERPAFFVTSAVRGGGKTTVLNVISHAIFGQRAAAAAWSPNGEERRKALFSYLLEGLPFLVWDNIPRGAHISCPHFEKALTADIYADRVLGVSATGAPFASTIQVFNGNRIGPRGDLVSRSLNVELLVSRLDPENRDFTHPDPFTWTMRHRGKILEALYTLLLGNPRRAQDPDERDPEPTRFKAWWDLVGSAVEHAFAVSYGVEMQFKDLFAGGEKVDEQATGIAMAVRLLHEVSKGERFQASDACRLAEFGRLSEREQDNDGRARAFRMALEQVHPKPVTKDVSAFSMSRRLRSICGVPVDVDGVKIRVTLRFEANHEGGWFQVE